MFLQQKVNNGETEYNQEEFEIGNDLTKAQIKKDLAEG